jgi:AAHS family 4-hydroxybenzoate transporter-like MFS transporter
VEPARRRRGRGFARRAVIAGVGVRVERAHLRVAGLCGVALCVEGYDIAAAGYAIPSLVDAWGQPPSAFTFVLTAGNVGLLFGSLSAGWLGGRLGRKRALVACVAAFGLLSLLCALAGSPSQLAGLRLLTGLGLGGGVPLAVALAADFAPAIAPARFVTLASIGVPIGFAVGGPLASQLVGAFGWPAIFLAGGALPLALAPFLVTHLPASLPPSEARLRNSVSSLFQSGLASSTSLLWAINLFSLLATYLALLWLPAILHGAGLSPSEAVFSASFFSFGVIGAALLSAFAIDRMSAEVVLTFGLAFGAACLLILALFRPPFSLLLTLICGAGFAGGCQGGINALSALAYPPAIRAIGVGWALGVGRIGAIAGPLVGGGLLALGWRPQGVFVAIGVSVLATTALMALLGRMRNHW